MKLITIFSAIALLLSSVSAERDLQMTPLETQWAVLDPELSYDGMGTFTISTEHGDGVNWVALGTYDLCPNGDASFNNANYQGSPFSYFSTNLNYIVGNTYSWVPGTNAAWQNVWSFQVNTLNIVGSSTYSEANGEGTASFCMRYGLVDTIAQNTFQLVNFRQMLITIHFDLEADFAVSSFYTQAIEEVTGTVQQDFQITATGCDPEGKGTTALPYNQGDEVCVSLCADGFAFFSAINWMKMSRVIPAVGSVQQDVYLNDAPVGNIVDDTLTFPSATNCVEIKFLLLGIFFPVDENQTPATAYVNGNGMATLTLVSGNRKLAEGERQLEESKEVEFEANFEILEYGENSGSPKYAFAGATLGALGAALML